MHWNVRRIAAALLCFCLLSACTKTEAALPVEPVPPPASAETLHSIAEYFPFTENTLYRYVGEGSELMTQDAFTLFADENGAQMFMENSEYQVTDIYSLEDGKLKILFNDVYFYYDNLLGTDDIRHLTVLQEPLELGSTWKYNREGSRCEVTNLHAQTQVPYGTFDTLEVTITHEGIIQRDYYALGVGLVRTTYETNGSEISTNLAEIIENATKTVEVDFCLANTTTDALAYEKRPLTLSTNMGFVDYFNTELKKELPADYQPLLPDDSKILSMSVDWLEVLLTVDLSADFRPGAGMGAEVESAALQALVNTLGNFYHVYNVELLLEGKPYSSGQIQRAEGEYWEVDLRLDPEAAE